MIETREQYVSLLGRIFTMSHAGAKQDAHDTRETIEALREVARAAAQMKEAQIKQDGLAQSLAQSRIWNALDALPDWLLEKPDD